MATPAVGADIESICSKCGDVWHVVVAKVGDDIAKVECKECHGVHRYRPPKGKAVARASVRKRGDQPASSSSRRKKEPLVHTVEADPTKPLRSYRASESFEPGERIQHPRFGVGVAQRSPGVGKIEILFADGARVLVQAKPIATLVPRRITFDE
jgi:hypothetical protein